MKANADNGLNSIVLSRNEPVREFIFDSPTKQSEQQDKFDMFDTQPKLQNQSKSTNIAPAPVKQDHSIDSVFDRVDTVICRNSITKTRQPIPGLPSPGCS